MSELIMSLDSTLRSRINEIDQTNNVEARLESLEDGQSYLVQRTQDIKLLKDEILRELSGEVRNFTGTYVHVCVTGVFTLLSLRLDGAHHKALTSIKTEN